MKPLCLYCGEKTGRRVASADPDEWYWNPFCTQRCAAGWAQTNAMEYSGFEWNEEADEWEWQL